MEQSRLIIAAAAAAAAAAAVVEIAEWQATNLTRSLLQEEVPYPKGPKYLYGTKYGFCSSNFSYGLGKYSPYGYLGPFEIIRVLAAALNLKP